MMTTQTKLLINGKVQVMTVYETKLTREGMLYLIDVAGEKTWIRN